MSVYLGVKCLSGLGQGAQGLRLLDLWYRPLSDLTSYKQLGDDDQLPSACMTDKQSMNYQLQARMCHAIHTPA